MTRAEILEGVERRRRWSSSEKMRIVEETLAPGACVSDVARRNGVAQSLLFSWRRQAREAATASTAMLLPVEISGPTNQDAAIEHGDRSERDRRVRSKSGLIEIELAGGRRVRVDARVDADALGRVLDVLARR